MRSIVSTAVLVGAVACFGAPAAATDRSCVDFADYLGFGTALDIEGSGMSIVTATDLAFVASNSGDVIVVDLADPDAPQILGSVPIPGYGWGIDHDAGHVYVADYSGNLHVIDVHDPAAPMLLVTLPIPGSPEDVTIAGDRAFIAARNPDLVVVDVSDPSAPAITAQLSFIGTTREVTVRGDRAYFASMSVGLTVVDITFPDAPQFLGYASGATQARGIDVRDDLACIAANDDGLVFYDVGDPTSPELVSALNPPGDAWDVHMSGDLVYVANGNDGLQVVDVADPATPRVIGAIDPGTLARDVDLIAGRAVIADVLEIVLVDITNPTSPEVAASVDADGIDLAVRGDYAYVASAFSGLQIVDIAEILDPQVVATIPSPSTPTTDVVLKGDYAYVGVQGDGIKVVDITDPTSPQVVFPGGGGAPMGLTLRNQYLYVANGDYGLMIYDLSQPTLPQRIAWESTPEYAFRVALHGDYAYVADRGSLLVFDCRNIFFPVIVNKVLAESMIMDVIIDGAFAYVADYRAGLRILDIADPAVPTEAARVRITGAASGVTRDGNLVYVANETGIAVVDVTDPLQPRLIGGMPTPDVCLKIVLVDDWLLGADVQNLVVLPTQCVATAVDDLPTASVGVVLHQNVPNPFNPATTIAWEQAAAATVRLDVHDLAGRRLRTLVPGDRREAGRHAVRWDGRDGQGRELAAGVYLARLRVGHEQVSGRMVLVR